MIRLECAKIQIGDRYSDDVFFNDGKNMFLAAHHPVKKYHVACLERWQIPFLWTAGTKMTEQDLLSAVQNDSVATSPSVPPSRKVNEKGEEEISLDEFINIDEL